MQATEQIRGLPYGVMTRPPTLVARPEETSVFLGINVIYRVGIIAIFVIVLMTIVLNVEVNRKSPAFVLLCLAQLLDFAVVLFPIIFYKQTYGWFHPLVFSTCQYMLFQFRSYATYLQGISRHRALPEYSPEDIVQVVAFALTLHAIATLAYYFGFWFGPKFKTLRLSFRTPKGIAAKAIVVVVDRKSVVYGKSVDLGGRRIIKKKKTTKNKHTRPTGPYSRHEQEQRASSARD